MSGDKTGSKSRLPGENVIGAAAEAGNRGFERTVAGLKDGVSAATAGFEQAQSSVREGMDKALRTAEEMVAYNQGNMEAALRSGQVLATGLQDLSRQATATAQSQLDETLSAFRALTSVKSVQEALSLQGSYARSSLEKAFAESSRLTEASFKLLEQAWAPLNQRLTVGAERLSNAA